MHVRLEISSVYVCGGVVDVEWWMKCCFTSLPNSDAWTASRYIAHVPGRPVACRGP